MTRILTASFLCLTLAFGAPTASAQATSDRIERLRLFDKRITDPDPTTRQVNMQEVLQSKDRELVERAVRLALGMQDPKMRSLALLGYLMAMRSLELKIVPPANLKEVMDAALTGSVNSQKAQQANANFAKVYLSDGGRVILAFDDINITTGDFKVYVLNFVSKKEERYSGSGVMRGTTATFRSNAVFSNNLHTCGFELRADASAKLAGVMNCNHNLGQFQLEASLYP